jgi:hypothetical protein
LRKCRRCIGVVKVVDVVDIVDIVGVVGVVGIVVPPGVEAEWRLVTGVSVGFDVGLAIVGIVDVVDVVDLTAVKLQQYRWSLTLVVGSACWDGN